MKKLLEQKIKVLVNENSSSRHFENRTTSCLVLGEEATGDDDDDDNDDDQRLSETKRIKQNLNLFGNKKYFLSRKPVIKRKFIAVNNIP